MEHKMLSNMWLTRSRDKFQNSSAGERKQKIQRLLCKKKTTPLYDLSDFNLAKQCIAVSEIQANG